jgi:maltooligosyltrehalose trehalohydrolase
LSQFPSAATPEVVKILAEPSSVQTFEQSKLDWREAETNAHVLRLYTDLLALRRLDPVFASQRSDRLHGAVLGADTLVLRFFGDEADEGRSDRLLLVNLGKDLRFDSCPEPLLAPPTVHGWKLLWSSESTAYGGTGTPAPEDATGIWKLPAYAAVVLIAATEEDEAHADTGRLEEG